MKTNTIALTVAALCAFAANSLLCRMALGHHLIDAGSFTTIRVFAGAATLALILLLRSNGAPRPPADWRAVAALAGYMVFFSFAYVTLSAGTGALILFSAVQLTMFTVALGSGERFPLFAWWGLALAVGGLVYLVSPGLSAPNPLGALLMIVAGIAWGFYSLRGRGVTDPLAATATNFLFTAPIVLIVSLVAGNRDISTNGALLAVASGAIASGCGYVIWFAALRGLSGTRAAVVQLAVPVIAAFGAVAFLAEPMTFRLLLATAATLGGVAIVLAQRAAR